MKANEYAKLLDISGKSEIGTLHTYFEGDSYKTEGIKSKSVKREVK